MSEARSNLQFIIKPYLYRYSQIIPVMKFHTLPLFALVIALLSCKDSTEHQLLGSGVDSEQALFASMESNTQWPSYRGYYASGYMDRVNLPDSFDIETSYHVKWSIGIPGLGLSCPVIWDDRVYITTAISETDKGGFLIGIYGDIEPVADSSEHIWMVYCIDKNSGEILWEREACRGIPMVKRHPKSSHANTTVATDGTRVVVFFGSEGLYCYDKAGSLLWKRDFGLINSTWDVVESAQFEFCSSPVIFQDKVIIQADALNTAFVAVLDLFSGKTVWRKDRDEISGWCTPNIYFDGDQARVTVNGYKHRGGYDLDTGQEIWEMSGGGDIPIPTPVVWKDLIYFNSAHGRHAPLMAIKNSATGVIPYPEQESGPGEKLAWFYDRGGSYMSSVLVYDSLLYRLRWNGNLACFDARSGTEVYQVMVQPTSFIASPVAADGRIYMVSEEGDLFIAATGPEYRLLKKIPLGGVSLVTPGITQGMMIFRTASRLIAVSNG
jgi:outer membrane protein assembly factor BamB